MSHWHFLRNDYCLNFDRQGEKVEVGKPIRHEGDLIPKQSGLHACTNALDALKYAPGTIVCFVSLGSRLIGDGDKTVSNERTVIWWADATDVLVKFARYAADYANDAAARAADYAADAAATADAAADAADAAAAVANAAVYAARAAESAARAAARYADARYAAADYAVDYAATKQLLNDKLTEMLLELRV